MELYAVNLDGEYINKQFNMLLTYVDEKKRGRILKLLKFEDAMRILIADILIRVLACKKMGICNEELVFNYNNFGKPLISNTNGFHFNISHSGDWVVCAVDDNPIGIDIEYIDTNFIHQSSQLAKRLFTSSEYKVFSDKSLSELDKLSYFFEVWTLKESYIKKVGKGLEIALNSFCVKIDGRHNILVNDIYDLNRSYFNQYDIDINYRLSVCASNNIFPDTLSIIQLSELCEQILSC